MKKIKIPIKNVYGNNVVYPACPESILFAKIAGTKTLTIDCLKLIRELGYEIEEVSAISLALAG